MSKQDGETFTPWTPEGAARLMEAAARVKEAVDAHARAVVAADHEITSVFEASEALVPALLAYADAQFDYTGNGFPFGVLEEWVEDDEDDEGQEEVSEEWPVEGLSVLQRHDYTVTDADALLAAGRQAYLRVWPDDTESAAAADVTHIGRALYQLAHADGWHSLSRVDGLEPVAGFVGVIQQEEMLGPDPDDWGESVLKDGDEVLYTQADVYRPPTAADR